MKRLVQAQAVQHDRSLVRLAAAHGAEARETVGRKPWQTLHRAQGLIREPRHVLDVRLRQHRFGAGQIRRQRVAARVHDDLFELRLVAGVSRPPIFGAGCIRARCNDGVDAGCCLQRTQTMGRENLRCEREAAACVRLSFHAQVDGTIRVL